MKAIFVTTANALGVHGVTKGGVQICTAEYLATLKAAGFDIETVSFSPDRRIAARLRRRVSPKPYTGLIPPTLARKVVEAVMRHSAMVIFLNVVDLAPLAVDIRKALGRRIRIVLLSHGLGCSDLLHGMRYRGRNARRTVIPKRDLTWLAGHLVAESEQRRFIDHVFCLSEFDVGLERWVGARSVSWLPRVVNSAPVAWAPIDRRIGFVGTVDHAPNAEGLELFLEALERKDNFCLQVRLIGGPAEAAAKLAARYSALEYLGNLDDDKLLLEAGTWSCAVHPLFCYSRGCSTKLAMMLGWHVPVVTTTPGHRGYIWNAGTLPTAETPEEFVELVAQISAPAGRDVARAQVAEVVQHSPTLTNVAAMIQEQLEPLGIGQ